MKRQLLLIVVMLTAILHLQAQMKDKEVSIIPRIGVNMASLKNVYGPVTGAGPAEGTPLETKMKAGLLIGCDLEMELSRPLIMDIGVYYSQQGCGFKDGRKAAQVDYLNIPVLLGAKPVRGLILKTGIQPGIKLSAKNIEEGLVNNLTVSVPVGISYEFRHFVLDARYVFGTSLFETESVNSRNKVISLTLGYRFTLGKVADRRPESKFYMPASDGNY